MGEFGISRDGREWTWVPNIIHDEGAETILRAMFPPYGSAGHPLVMRLSGAYAQHPAERPNVGGGNIFREDTWGAVVDPPQWNTDGTAYPEVKALIDMYGKEMTWSSTLQAHMGDFESDPVQFTNAVPWAGTPQSWYRDVIDPPEPSRPLMANAPFGSVPIEIGAGRKLDIEPDHGAPWHQPNWHIDWLCGSQGCGTDFELAMVFSPWRAASFPVGAIVVQGNPAPNQKLFFSARMLEPFRVMPGETLYVKYRGLIKPRFPNSPSTITGPFAKLMADLIAGLNPNIQGYAAALSTSALSRFDTMATLEELEDFTSPGYARKDLDPWDVTGPEAETYVLSRWENTSPDPWAPVRSLAVLCFANDSPMLAWSYILDQPYTLAPGESLDFEDPIKLILRDE